MRTNRHRCVALFRSLGLTVVVASAVFALAGSASASTSTLCLTNANPCPPADQVPVGDNLHGTLISPTAKLHDNTLNADVTCTSSTFDDTITANPGVSDRLTSLTFDGTCQESVLHSNCTAVTNPMSPGIAWGTVITANATPPPDGTVTISIPTGQGVVVTCPIVNYKCTWTGANNSVTGNLYNPTTASPPKPFPSTHAEVDFAAVPVTSPDCGGRTGTWTATYTVVDSTQGGADVWIEPDP